MVKNIMMKKGGDGYKIKKKQVLLLISMVIILGGLFAVLLYQVKLRNIGNIEHRLQWWRTEIGAENRVKMATGNGVKIAILDTGVDCTHPDLLASKIKEVRIEGLEATNDDKVHGTAVAGIIAAYPNDSEGVLGIAPLVEIISIDVTDSEYVEPENIIAGIEMAIKEDVDIISISLGLKEDNSEVHAVIKRAYEKGIVIVASAGNYMESDVLYPAKYDEVLCVGALNKKGEIVSPKGALEKKVVYLPGENIVTTYSGERLYVGATGTSFSTAILSGIIALMIETNPDITIQEIYTYFEELLYNSEVTIDKCLDFK